MHDRHELPMLAIQMPGCLDSSAYHQVYNASLSFSSDDRSARWNAATKKTTTAGLKQHARDLLMEQPCTVKHEGKRHYWLHYRTTETNATTEGSLHFLGRSSNPWRVPAPVTRIGRPGTPGIHTWPGHPQKGNTSKTLHRACVIFKHLPRTGHRAVWRGREDNQCRAVQRLNATQNQLKGKQQTTS